MLKLPPLYAIVDARVLAAHGLSLEPFAHALCAAGVILVQYRDKIGSPQDVLRAAASLSDAFGRGKGSTPRQAKPDLSAGSGQAMRHPMLIMNDRADLAVLAGFDGVHVGQGDMSPEDAGLVVGASRIVGVSTHTEAQVRLADQTAAGYIAIGPVFATGTKPDAEPVLGLEGVRRARALTEKPLVAIGGITRANARSVIAAGADSLAVISAFFAPGEAPEKVARDFLDILR